MASLRLLVGSVTGRAQALAEQLAQHLRTHGHTVTLLTAPVFDDVATSTGPLLVVTSTTGQGELPQVMALLHQALRDGLPWQPGRPFGVVMLGDSSYANYCGGGEQMREVLMEMGAQEVTAPLRIDASADADESTAALAWASDFADALAP